MKEPTIFKVSAKTTPGKLAEAIAEATRKGEAVSLEAIGAGAVNTAVKSVSIANGMLAPAGKRLAILPGFRDLLLDGLERTSMLLKLKEVE